MFKQTDFYLLSNGTIRPVRSAYEINEIDGDTDYVIESYINVFHGNSDTPPTMRISWVASGWEWNTIEDENLRTTILLMIA